MKRTHFFLPEPAFERLQELSKRLDISVAELIRRAIDDFLKKQK
jgi:predicted DNA-binding protein